MVMISYARLDITALNIGISLVALFILLFSGLIIHKKISVILFSRKVKRLRANLILNFVLSFALLVLTFVVALIARNALQSGLSLYIKFEPAIGPIVAFFSGLLLLVFSKQREQKKVDLTYDDPDVSYAPYVVDDN